LRRQSQDLSHFGVKLPAFAARGQSLVEIFLSLVKSIDEGCRLFVESIPEVVKQRSDQFASAQDFERLG